MSDFRVLIVVASGSDENDVILTASLLRQCGVTVVIASTEGWSPVTLRNGITIKPDCSVDRAVTKATESEIFNVLLLPDGDDISIGRISNNCRLKSAVKIACGDKNYQHKLKKRNYEELLNDKNLFVKKKCIIASGKCYKVLQKWNVIDQANSSLWGGNLCRRSYSWLFTSGLKGSDVVYYAVDSIGAEECDVIVCAPLLSLKVASVCLSVVKSRLGKSSQEFARLEDFNEFRSDFSTPKYGMHSLVSQFSMQILNYVSTSPLIPKSVRSLLKNTIKSSQNTLNEKIEKVCSSANCSVEDKDMNDAFKKENYSIKSCVAKYIVKEIWNFTMKSLQMTPSHKNARIAAVLVTNRVDERLLVLLVSELRQKYSMLVQIIACDRSLLQTNDPFLTTNRFFYIRSDDALEKCKVVYDVILTIESDIYPIGTRIWCRNELFPSDETSCNISKLSANFGTNVPRKNPFTNKEIDYTKDRKLFEGYYGNIFKKETELLDRVDGKNTHNDSKFFRISENTSSFHDSHEAMFRTFEALQLDADMNIMISEKNVMKSVTYFAKAVSECLELLMIKKGYVSANIPKTSACMIQ